MKRTIVTWFLTALVIVVLLTISGAFYSLQEQEQALITQFGQPIGAPITNAGLHFKVPFVQTVNIIEKRVLEWDGPSTEMPTKDKLYIVVDAFGRWRVSDPLQYFIRLNDETRAQTRLNDILGSEIRNTVARHELVEVVRTTKGRKPQQDEVLAAALGNTSLLPDIQFGRVNLEKEIADAARSKVKEFGIELLDLRFKRIDYNPAVATKIFDRMISERRQIADRFRSEGAGEAARILGKRERDTKEIESEAYRKIQAIQGKADGEATAIYAQAYNQTPEAREFYTFQRALETYQKAFQRETTIVLTTSDPFLRYLMGQEDKEQKAPPQPAAAQ
jgi:membrane protease subunit HflC